MRIGRIVNSLLQPLGLRVVRVSQGKPSTKDNDNPMGIVIQCLVPDRALVEHICRRPKTADQAHVEGLEKVLFEGGRYESYKGQLTPLREFLGRVALPNDFHLLDVGCAVGQLVPFLKEIGFSGKYVGFDVVHGFVVAARHRFNALQLFHFLQADATKMPFRDASFDVVYSRSTLISTYDWKRALQEHLRVSKKWILLLEVPFHFGGQETVFFMQHSKLHTSLLCSFTRDAFLGELPKNVRVKIHPSGSGFEVINFGRVEWNDVVIELL